MKLDIAHGCSLPPVNAQFSANAPVPDQVFDKIIAGGGLAAIFTAYEILKQAKDARKKISVLVVAEEISAPCSAGSQMVPVAEGTFYEKAENSVETSAAMREAYTALKLTIRRVSCRHTPGYEIKAMTKDELDHAVTGMTSRGIFKTDEILPNSRNQIFNLPGHNHSVLINSFAGQVNMPELLDGLVANIREMGGRIEQARYQSHAANGNGFTAQTNKGLFHSRTPPLIATGAKHHKAFFDFRNIECNVIHTMALVLGSLSVADAWAIAKRSMAMTDAILTGDFLWGGIDDKFYFTFGRGDTDDTSPENIKRIYADITGQIENFYPGIIEKYPPRVFFGPMLVPKNRMPIVGRMPECDVAGGWSGMGVVAGYAAALAFADWVVHGRDQKLKFFESFHPGKFAMPEQIETPAEPPARLIA
ncbi:MAG: FAD-dependent oxidoreductase [Alphaproteobacteria bacterium]